MIVTDHGVFNLLVDNDQACMDFNPTGTRYPQDLITSSFERECRYLDKFKSYSWCPEVTRVDSLTRKVFFKWYNNNADSILPSSWKTQVDQIVHDLHTEQVWKPSFYTKYFYTDNNDQLHAWAFYSSSDYAEQPIDMNFYQPILNPQRKALIDQLQVNGTMDMGVLVKHAFTDYIKWPEDYLPESYHKIHQ